MERKKFLIALRIEEERKPLGLTQDGLAKECNVSIRTVSSWANGKSMPDAEALAAMASLGMDVQYIVTGQRSRPLAVPAPDDACRKSLAERGIEWSPPGERPGTVVVKPLGLLWLGNYAEDARSAFDFSVDASKRLVDYESKTWRDLHLQAIQLRGHGDKKYPQLLAYLDHSPPRTPWSLSPWFGLQRRNELDTGAYDLPLKITDATLVAPLLVLPDDVYAGLNAGQVVTIRNDQKKEPGQRSLHNAGGNRKAA